MKKPIIEVAFRKILRARDYVEDAGSIYGSGRYIHFEKNYLVAGMTWEWQELHNGAWWLATCHTTMDYLDNFDRLALKLEGELSTLIRDIEAWENRGMDEYKEFCTYWNLKDRAAFESSLTYPEDVQIDEKARMLAFFKGAPDPNMAPDGTINGRFL